MNCSNSLFTGRTVHKTKVNSRRDPFSLNNMSYAFKMENMTTANSYTGHGT